MEYFICYKGRKLLGPLEKEEAIKELFKLRGTFKNLYILQIDMKTGKVKRKIGRNDRSLDLCSPKYKNDGIEGIFPLILNK
jgi:hypothetical protein